MGQGILSLATVQYPGSRGTLDTPETGGTSRSNECGSARLPAAAPGGKSGQCRQRRGFGFLSARSLTTYIQRKRIAYIADFGSVISTFARIGDPAVIARWRTVKILEQQKLPGNFVILATAD
jgi:hypothetical protein